MRTAITALVATALVGTFGWGHASAQAPAQPAAPLPCVPDGDVRFICGLQAPEDLVMLPGNQWVIASAFSGAGGLYAIGTRDQTPVKIYPSAASRDVPDTTAYPTCPGAPDAAAKAKFSTHGLWVGPGPKGTTRLYVVAHGSRESVEVYNVDAKQSPPALTWIGCAVAADPIGLNSVRGLPDGGFIASNFLARGIDAATRQRMLDGEKNGELWEWHAKTGWQKLPGSEAAGANGLEMSKDGKTLYISAWGSQSFLRLSRGKAQPTRDEVPLGFRVDNIRWAKDGAILAVGQGGVAPNQTTNIARVDPKSMKVTPVRTWPNGPAFGAGTVAVEVGADLWVGSFRGDRLAVIPAKR